MSAWKRIPAEVKNEHDRRDLAGILTQAGLEVRIVKVKETPRGTPKTFLECREQKTKS